MLYNGAMLQDDIKKALICHHIFPNKKGYKYLMYVMEYAIEGCGKTLSEIYVLVAEKCGVKPNAFPIPLKAVSTMRLLRKNTVFLRQPITAKLQTKDLYKF